ncbi:MAG TPA: hypothetical protein VFC82_05770 [Actinomycetaceae bacterium]|nr:hypothetical protein [Actinomycetaceae bacterium]
MTALLVNEYADHIARTERRSSPAPRATQRKDTNMTLFVNEYVDHIGRQELLENLKARITAETETPAQADTQTDADNGSLLSGIVLVLINLLLVTAIGVSASISTAIAWMVTIGLAITAAATAAVLKDMFGTDPQG